MVSWVFPSLWQQAIVPVDVVRVEPQLALLNVLLDWGSLFILSNTQTCLRKDPSLQGQVYTYKGQGVSLLARQFKQRNCKDQHNSTGLRAPLTQTRYVP